MSILGRVNYVLTTQINLLQKIGLAEFTEKIDCPIWNQFLNDIFHHDKELIRFIQKAIGYSLTGSTVEQCAFLLWYRA